MKYLEVDANTTGQRLDNFLLRYFKGVPKTHIYRIIRSGEVRLNKSRAHAHNRVQTGDIVRIPPTRVPERTQAHSQLLAPKPPACNFPILFEDNALIAIDKPAGVAVHGGSGVSFGIIEQLRHSRPQATFLELVHRLDRETSGILLIAKKRSALTHLQEQFRQRSTDKIYLALTLGDWPSNKKVIDTPLHKYLLPGHNGQEGERRVKTTHKSDPNAMHAVTLVKVGQRLQHPLDTFTLLEVTIKTGRTHQIRVHLASQGHPIAGDAKYGNFDQNKALYKAGLKRMFLHAWQLRFTHPATAETIELLAPLPLELEQWVNTCNAKNPHGVLP